MSMGVLSDRLKNPPSPCADHYHSKSASFRKFTSAQASEMYGLDSWGCALLCPVSGQKGVPGSLPLLSFSPGWCCLS